MKPINSRLIEVLGVQTRFGIMLTRVPANVVLLAGGRGRRMVPLTDRTHKSLSPIWGRPALQYALDPIVAAGCQDIVCVTGYKQDDIRQFLTSTYGNTVRTVHNEQYADDINILSTELGVNTLRRPDLGYLVVETDIFLEASGWNRILSVDTSSFWVTRGTYSPDLTGGVLHADSSSNVTEIIYAPTYNAQYEGWPKLFGILYVGAGQVANDRAILRRAIERTISQYYMTPWTENLPRLPCKARDLGDAYGCSYNDIAAYQRVADDHRRKLGMPNG
jgi:hypothetical protein